MNQRNMTIGLVAGLLAGCSLEPAYHRPAPPVPVAWPSGAAYGPPTDSTITDWQQAFPTAKLQHVIALALVQSRDLRVAIAQIEADRAQYRIQRAALLPTIDASVSASTGRSYTGLPAGQGGAYANSTTYSASVGTTAYELDLFGRVHSLTKAALETYLATVEAKASTRISLIAQVATDYVTFAADTSQLAASQTTVVSAQANFDLARRRLAGGIASQLDVSSARTIVEQARADVALYTTLVAQDRNALELVVGAPVASADLPGGIDDPATLIGTVPGALDSRILLQRPDVVEAEHTLRSANANIGAARAAFFPSISLTGSGGTESKSISGLFSGGSAVWSFAPSITLPIFTAGANKAHLGYARAEDQIAVAQYEKAIQTAFREVADTLAQSGTIAERLRAQQAEVAAAEESLHLAEALYARGSDSYLDVLTAQRTYYAAQQSLISVQLVKSDNVITLYKVLGGALRDRIASP